MDKGGGGGGFINTVVHVASDVIAFPVAGPIALVDAVSPKTADKVVGSVSSVPVVGTIARGSQAYGHLGADYAEGNGSQGAQDLRTALTGGAAALAVAATPSVIDFVQNSLGSGIEDFMNSDKSKSSPKKPPQQYGGGGAAPQIPHSLPGGGLALAAMGGIAFLALKKR